MGTGQQEISRRDFLGAALAAGTLGAAWSARAPFMSVGICDPSGHGEDFAAYGYTFVEPAVHRFLVPERSEAAFQANRADARKAGLPTPVANQFLPSSLKVVGGEADHEAALRYAGVAFRRARIAGIEHIVFGSGGARNIPDGFAREDAVAQFVDLLSRMAPQAAEHGVTLCLEPLRSQETNFLNTVPACMEIVQGVSHASVQLTCDIYHIMQQGRGPADIALAGASIRHCHIAENRDRSAPGVHGDDFTPFLAALKSLGYRGRISVECRFSNRAAELAGAVRVLSNQMASV